MRYQEGVFMTQPFNIHPQYITNDEGEKLSVVLPIEEFESMIEDYEDLLEVSKRKDEETISHEDLITELKKDGLL